MRKLLGSIALVLGMIPVQSLAQDQAAAPAAGGNIMIELNKLQQVDNRCDSYFEIRNTTDKDVQQLSFKAYLFDTEGIIIVAPPLYNFLDLRAGKSRVQMFSIKDTQCDRIARWLINEVVQCTGDLEGKIEIEGCGDFVTMSSKEKVVIEY